MFRLRRREITFDERISWPFEWRADASGRWRQGWPAQTLDKKCGVAKELEGKYIQCQAYFFSLMYNVWGHLLSDIKIYDNPGILFDQVPIEGSFYTCVIKADF